jgi:radical SAM superfamily enzyme YgiQ (UPF0313 family)
MHGLIFNVTRYPYVPRPLGGHRIAHFLREQGWDIEVVDWANWWSQEQLQQFFVSRVSASTKFVGFSHLFNIWNPVLETFGTWIKDHYPEIKLISGSAVNPMFKSQCLDYYIQGFGEHAIEALLRYIVGNGPRPTFNLTMPNGIKVINAINSYPAFPMKSLMVKYQDRDFVRSNEWLTIETSRGCAFSCAFCNFPVLGVKGDYTRDQHDFELQLNDAFDRFGVQNYILADETFNDRADKITKFADAVERLDFDPWFSAYIRADLMAARPDTREELLRMNCLGHFYGIESFNQPSAKAVGKGMASDRLKEALVCSRSYFESHGRELYRGSIGLIAGLPFETKDMLDQTYDWLIENWQQQSFSIRPLSIPVHNQINKSSKISDDMLKYGYEEMSEQEIQINAAAGKQLHGHHLPMTIDEVIWKNTHMDWFVAKKHCEDILDQKKQYDFRPSCHYIGYNLTGDHDIAARLRYTYPKFDCQLTDDISWYVEKKLTEAHR